MKSQKILFAVFFLTCLLSACENHMDIRDIETGTPTNADSILPAKHHGFPPAEMEAYKEALPRVYKR